MPDVWTKASAWVFLLSSWQGNRWYLCDPTTPIEMLPNQTNQAVRATNESDLEYQVLMKAHVHKSSSTSLWNKLH